MFIADHNVWERLVYSKSANVYPVTEPVRAVFVQEYLPEYDKHSGEWAQGGEDIYIIFQVGDKFYKKHGRISSYGDKSWDGQVVEVKKTVKTIEVFE